MADSIVATVTATIPLTVLVDGADTVGPAEALVGLTLYVNDRVQMTVRTPQQPLITGVVTTSA